MMRAFATFAFVFLGACQSVPKPRAPMRPEALFKFVRPKIVELMTDDRTKGLKDLRKYAGLGDKDFNFKRGFCTGFIVDEDVVLTAHHCVQNFVEVVTGFVIKTSDGKQFAVKRLLGVDLAHDVAVLEVKGLKKYGKLDLAVKAPIGAKVYTVGNVLGEGIAIRDGLISSVSDDPDKPELKFLRYSAAASPGNSGGPLVDARGDVVALVFASANRAENNNIGALSTDLRKILKRFAENRKTKTVSLAGDDHHYFQPAHAYRMLGIPVPGPWTRDPEVVKSLAALKFSVKFPLGLEPFVAASANGANQAATEARALAGKLAAKRIDPKKLCSCERTWEEAATDKMPLVIPSQVTRDFEYLELDASARRPVPTVAFVTPPADLGASTDLIASIFAAAGLGDVSALLEAQGSGAADVEARLVPTRAETPKRLRLAATDAFFSSVPRKARMRLSSVAYSSWLFGKTGAKPAQGWATLRQPASAELLGAIGGDFGLSFESSHPLVRPKARREFYIERLDEKLAKDEVKDPLGRTWTVFHTTMFDEMTVESYCLPLPQGWSCLVSGSPATDAALLKVARENTVRYTLAKLLVQPAFWDVDSLLDFAKSGHAATDPLMRDFEISKTSLKLKTLGIELSWPAGLAPSAVRLSTGLQRTGKTTRWVALGAEGVVSDKDGPKLCGMGVELPGTDAVALLRLEKRLAGTGGTPAPGRLHRTPLPKGVSAYGWCAPLAEPYVKKKSVRVPRYERLAAYPITARAL